MKESADAPVERAGVYDRPSARFDWEGQLEVRASAASGCRRALWYAATGHEPAPPDDKALTVMETGRALEPVVLRAMQRAGWEVTPVDAQRPTKVILQLTPTVKVTGAAGASVVAPSLRILPDGPGAVAAPHDKRARTDSASHPRTDIAPRLSAPLRVEPGTVSGVTASSRPTSSGLFCLD